MAGLLIIAHAPLATALQAVARHAFPDCGLPLEALDVPPGMSPEEIERAARGLLAQVRTPEALIFTDVFGATPCNVAQRLAESPQVKVVTGVNVPMLWRTLCYAAEPLDALVARALAGATQGAMQVAALPEGKQSPAFVAHDPQDRRHQQ